MEGGSPTLEITLPKLCQSEQSLVVVTGGEHNGTRSIAPRDGACEGERKGEGARGCSAKKSGAQLNIPFAPLPIPQTPAGRERKECRAMTLQSLRALLAS